MDNRETLRVGARGEAVVELQTLLESLGFAIPVDEHGTLGEHTAVVLEKFQDQQGLRADRVCGPQTWAALIESSYELGDRLLCFRQPHLRGDDVTQLQARLNKLGFDAGREDGILGTQTGDAIREFQRNAGLSPDGIAGPSTYAALRTLGSFAAGSFATVRERESYGGNRPISATRIFIACDPALQKLGNAIVSALSAAGAPIVSTPQDEDESITASMANQSASDLALCFRVSEIPDAQCTFFTSGDFRSEVGAQVAGSIAGALAAHSGFPDMIVAGKRYPFLRETRMPAVLCEIPIVENRQDDELGKLIAQVVCASLEDFGS